MHHIPYSPTMYWNNGSPLSGWLSSKRQLTNQLTKYYVGECIMFVTHQQCTETMEADSLSFIGEYIFQVIFLTLKNLILDYFILSHFFSRLCGGAVSVWSVHFCAHWSQLVAGIWDGRRVVFDFKKNLVTCQNRKDAIVDRVKVIPVLCTRNHRSNIGDRELAVLLHDQTQDGI